MKNQRIMVTGGAGFIWSNLVEELARDNEVFILDDLSTDRMENIKELLKMDNVRFTHGSVTDMELLQRSFNGIDYVFQQAALASVPGSIEDPVASNNVNINGTLNVLVAARDNNVTKVVFASSCAVYGDAEIMPIAETSPFKPKSPYPVSKLAAEYSELAGTIIDLLGKDMKPVHESPREGDIRESVADVSKARAIGYKAGYSLEKGLRETMEWFNNGVI